MADVMTVNEIKAELKKLGIEFEKDAKKPELMELLAGATKTDDAEKEDVPEDEDGVEEPPEKEGEAVAPEAFEGKFRTLCKVFVRDSPAGEIVRTEEEGSPLTVTGKSGDWCQLDDGNFIMGTFIARMP
jgi:hypothetical protein